MRNPNFCAASREEEERAPRNRRGARRPRARESGSVPVRVGRRPGRLKELGISPRRRHAGMRPHSAKSELGVRFVRRRQPLSGSAKFDSELRGPIRVGRRPARGRLKVLGPPRLAAAGPVSSPSSDSETVRVGRSAGGRRSAAQPT